MIKRNCFQFLLIITLLASCSKDNGNGTDTPPVTIKPPVLQSMSIQNSSFNTMVVNQPLKPVIKLSFTQPVKTSTIATAVTIKDMQGNMIPVTTATADGDATIMVEPAAPLSYLVRYNFSVSNSLQSASGGGLATAINQSFITKMDSSRKFPALSKDALLDKVQQQTLKYFWEFAHPVSFMSREGSKHSADIVTSGGTGFGIMSWITGAERGFIAKAEVLVKLQTMVTFLKDKAQTFHGAYPHWLNGGTGTAIAFSTNDNGADIVETSYLVAGLLTARQYFSGSSIAETNLRNDINTIVDRVEWSWFRQSNQNVLYWHWSADKAWVMNHKIQGWNECLITYVLAAASKNYSIPKAVYDEGWTRNGAMKNGNSFYNYVLPLGENLGGPLFFSHYSFLGLNPNGLSDSYANYETQTKHHTLINYSYSRTNPKSYFGYSDSVWGLTASNIKNGYTASSPANDQGFIAPTAALSSMPYTPDESLAALNFYYYVLGDQLFKEYGFVDAFSLNEVKNGQPWYDNAFLAIDQGPIIVMIENYRSRLLWNLFMGAPEIKTALQKLGFTGPGI